MFCPNCGKQLPEGSRFCAGCGTQLNARQAT
ncbi:MAG: zinc-ribbon domain-containing protein, partial [Lachnospiraceae bacterium]|nr:zinc-ribbon domain-containing protein [Lachnospiraceae bacterium]